MIKLVSGSGLNPFVFFRKLPDYVRGDSGRMISEYEPSHRPYDIIEGDGF